MICQTLLVSMRSSNSLTDNVLRLCDGRQKKNLIINRDVSGGYCKTAVSRWPFSQIKIK